ncbi:hypothetical protein BGZ65_011572, partial [Modicella reniformis]
MADSVSTIHCFRKSIEENTAYARQCTLPYEGHGNLDLFPNIRLEFPPPNSTSVRQPLDVGGMSVFKFRYRQIVGDETFKLRVKEKLTFEEQIAGSFSRIWKVKVPNLQAWRIIV